jgi:peroxiredoxin
MVDLYKAYNDKNVTFLGINSNKQESIKEIANHSNENGFQFTVLKDENNIIADKYKAQVTPEIFVVNGNMEVLYHGRIDDSRRANDVKSEDLRNALDAVLADKNVPVKETKAFGCTIKRVN